MDTMHLSEKKRKKKVKVLPFKIKWQRFLNRNPRLFLYIAFISFGVIFAINIIWFLLLKKN